MRILVLGGTAWLGATVAAEALRRGHDVTCLARGESGAAPEGASFVRADRSDPHAYDEVRARTFDAAVDVASQPGHVRGAVRALCDSVSRYCYVSSASVYREDRELDQDESAETLEPLVDDVMSSVEDYGSAKVACEEAVLERFGSSRSLIARAGLIGGPGDRSGRTGYWPTRFAMASGDRARVLVPEAEGSRAQIIDVRDLAAWILDAQRAGVNGVYNACGNTRPFGEFLQLARGVAGHTGPLSEAPSQWLLDRGVAPWMGPRSLPIWLPFEEYAGHAARSNRAILAAGLITRALVDTLADTLAWELDGQFQPHGAGLTEAEERSLLLELAAIA